MSRVVMGFVGILIGLIAVLVRYFSRSVRARGFSSLEQLGASRRFSSDGSILEQPV